MTKKNFTLLIAFSFIALTAFAQQVEERQRTVITKRTATWCSNCGSWGWTLMENLITDNAEKAILIAAHEDGSSLSIPAAEEITANWGSFAQPSFFVNEVNQNAFSSNISTKRTEIKDQVDAAFEMPPIANVGFNPVYLDGEIKVDAKVKFFQAATGDFYLGIYLLEDNVFAAQAGSVSDDIHKRVLQYSFTDGSWGMPLADGSVALGAEFDQSFSLPIGDPTGSDYHVVGIIWNLEGGIYKPVNAWSTTQIGLASSIEEVNDLTKLQITPNIIQDKGQIQLELTNHQTETSVDLFNLAGRKVANIHNGALSGGPHTFDISRNLVQASGMYFIRFTDGSHVETKRIVFN